MESINNYNNEDVILEILGVSKFFPKVIAVNDVSLKIRKGEIHCLLGENGAGKSTLAHCIYGYYHPDEGEIQFMCERVVISSPNDAINLGIGMVHQHFVLIEPLTVIENIVLGTKDLKPFDNFKQAEKRIQSLANQYGITLDLHAKIQQLSVGEQQWVEIIKALYTGVDLLILDEPTAVLTPQESQQLFSVLTNMKNEGLAIVFITHKFKEVMELSDIVTVLRKGELIDTVKTNQTTKSELAKMMVGREVIFNVKRETREIGEPIIQVKDLRTEDDIHQEALKGITFSIRRGEILGLAGVAGNGQKELFEVLVGYRKATAGEICIGDKVITNQSPRMNIDNGICYIPDDRMKNGVISDFSIWENYILGLHHRPEFRNGLFMDFNAIRKNATECVEQYDVMTPSIEQPIKFLSGGNIQKVILARELEQSPLVILANQPTRGLDVGVIEYVHQKLIEKCMGGAAILLASEELEDLFSLTDRIAVIFQGEILGIFPTQEVSMEQIGLLMGGIREDI